jgi:hypothetical protein
VIEATGFSVFRPKRTKQADSANDGIQLVFPDPARHRLEAGRWSLWRLMCFRELSPEAAVLSTRLIQHSVLG